MNVSIRTYDDRDRRSVVELWRRCGLVYPQNDPDKDIDRKLRHGTELFLVAVEGENRIVATAMGGYEGHRGWVNYVAVAPELRGRGLGRAIMDDLEDRFRRLGCAKINLQVRTSNTGVMEFYQRLGFRTDDVVCMGKRLESDEDPGDAGPPTA
jgi:ribosomal protein S18 acetylase RimI-like enzyme